MDAHGPRYANRDVPTCYRHPDRETGSVVLRVRPPDLHRLRDVRAGRPTLPRPRRGRAQAPRQRPQRAQQRSARRLDAASGPTDAIVTKILVAVNVIVYLITVAQGAGLNEPRRLALQQLGALRARASTTATGGG